MESSISGAIHSVWHATGQVWDPWRINSGHNVAGEGWDP